MVKCDDCDLEMLAEETMSCTYRFILFGEELYERDTKYFDFNDRCHDCGIFNNEGNIHHQGCDIERCPKCGKQFISCSCGFDDGENFTGKFYKTKEDYERGRD